ncbi:MAG: hypothetical protein E6I73_10645 [Chloroflexi bacterium]|nr:MAG: hypothetical protein E6I73_10645 [Chloroflexota bacterium]
MNWAFIRREWGAVTFVLTVLVGMVVVPLALYFTNAGATPVAVPNVSTTSSARASGVISPSPSATTSPAHSPSPSPSK